MKLMKTIFIFVATAAAASLTAGEIPLTNWTAPSAWSPSTVQHGRLQSNADLSHAMPFFSTTPCRAYDSRVSEGGAGPLTAASPRVIDIDGSPCGPIPDAVGAYSLNITVFNAPGSAFHFLTAYPAGTTRPTVSTLNFKAGNQVTNSAVVPASAAGDIEVYSSSDTEIVIDINGYYSNFFNSDRALIASTQNQIAIFGVSSSAIGVYGASDTEYGVVAQSTDFDGLRAGGGRDGANVVGTRNGLVARSNATSGKTVGVLGQSSNTSDDAHGVRGIGGGLPGGGSLSGFIHAGVAGYSVDGYGVLGLSEFNGVQGAVLESGIAVVRGRLGYKVSGNYYGVYSAGRAHVAGTLTKSGGSFKIDHPGDPENKYLSHSFVESPDMMNVYNGNAVLDASGRVVVQLPDYFESLNREFRYQLTPIGAPGPDLFIEQEIAGNQFIVAGGRPGSKVSWQVTGVRKDPWAEQNRIAVVEEKRKQDRGYYLNPTAYGLPEDRSLEAREEADRRRPEYPNQ